MIRLTETRMASLEERISTLEEVQNILKKSNAWLNRHSTEQVQKLREENRLLKAALQALGHSGKVEVDEFEPRSFV